MNMHMVHARHLTHDRDQLLLDEQGPIMAAEENMKAHG